jgi:hypothetical protein
MTDDMQLPAGKTCGDCHSWPVCSRLFGCPETNTTCDWSPSQFVLRLEPELERDTRTIDMFAEPT